MSAGLDVRTFDWRGFVDYMCQELFEHAREARWAESTVTVRETDDDEDDCED